MEFDFIILNLLRIMSMYNGTDTNINTIYIIVIIYYAHYNIYYSPNKLNK